MKSSEARVGMEAGAELRGPLPGVAVRHGTAEKRSSSSPRRPPGTHHFKRFYLHNNFEKVYAIL